MTLPPPPKTPLTSNEDKDHVGGEASHTTTEIQVHPSLSDQPNTSDVTCESNWDMVGLRGGSGRLEDFRPLRANQSTASKDSDTVVFHQKQASQGIIIPPSTTTMRTRTADNGGATSDDHDQNDDAFDYHNAQDATIATSPSDGSYTSPSYLCGTCVGFFKSNLTAFVTFLKAMFGVSLLSSPYVMDETGLVLGTIAYVVIIAACTFACYLILKARVAVAAALHDRHKQQHIHNQHAGEPPISRMKLFIAQATGNVTVKDNPSITFGVLGKELFGGKMSVSIIFLIVTLHVFFGAGMLASASHQLSVGFGWQTENNYYNNGDEEGEHESEDEEQEDDDYFFHNMPKPIDRLMRVCLLFPIVATLLQFRSQFELFMLCSAGLCLYVIGCLGSIFYTTILLAFNSWSGNYDDDYEYSEESEDSHSNDDHGEGNAPDDMWQWKFSGIPHFVASTVCAIEGINLALPTANSLQHQRSKQQREAALAQLLNNGGNDQHHENNHRTSSLNSINAIDSNEISNAIPVVSAVIIVYGMLTLLIAWIGYLNGLGGGEGTAHGEQGDTCEQIAYCLDSELLTKIHQISLGTTLLLTLPIILYPSIEMLEIWADEREIQLNTGRTSSDRSIASGWNGFVMGGNGLRKSLMSKFSQFESDPRRMNNNGGRVIGGKIDSFDDDDDDYYDDEKPRKKLLPKHWRLRLGHAIAISILAVAKRSFEPMFALLKGIGLSFVGFMLPCIFFVQAHNKYHMFGFGNIGIPMKLAQTCLVALGISNIVLVYLSVFTATNYLPEHEIHREGGPPGEEQEQEVEQEYVDDYMYGGDN